MKLEQMQLRNFRCFEELVIDFDDRLTVFVAENGEGKTALLDAIAIGFGRYLTKLPGISGIAFKDTDLRIVNAERNVRSVVVAWKTRTRDGTSIMWSTSRGRGGPIRRRDLLNEDYSPLLNSGTREIDDFTNGIIEYEAEQRPYFLPIIAYYGTNRAIRDEVQRRRGFRRNFSRIDALAGALEPNSSFRAAFEWFNAMEDLERREREGRRDFGYQLPELQVVRDAILRMLLGRFSRPRTEIRPLRFVIDHTLPDGTVQTLRISQLSDGYRVILGLAMDLARRMAEANSSMLPEDLQGMSPLDLPAIALIDEIDLHLHPSWQQRVLHDLMQTFTNTQFIVTTHSPQVLSTVKRENIRAIGPDPRGQIVAVPPLAMTYGEPSSVVLHSVMLVDPQPPVPEKADLERLTELVDQGLYRDNEAISILQRLDTSLGQQHPQLQRLRRSIRRQEILRT